MSLESRDVPVTTDRPADNVEAVGQPLRSPARHPIPIADSFVFQHARSSYGLSPSSFRNLKERSFKNLVKQTGGGRERSASCGNYSTPLLNTVGVFPGFSPYRALSPPMPPDIASPFMPNLGPPTLSSSQAVMDAVLASERKRMKEKELEEQNMSVEEIKAVLKRERIRMSRMAADLASLKSNLVQNQAEAEVNEEGRINCLLAHLDGLQQEKGRIIVELEREEEMLTNTLQKKLNEVKREKEILELQIQREQHAHNEMKSKFAKRKPLEPVIGNEGDDEGDDAVQLEDLAAMHESMT